jgi:hypothetical protein
MNVVFDGDLKEPEIKISGERRELWDLGIILLNLREKGLIESEGINDRFYPELLSGLVFELEDVGDEEALLTVALSGGYATFKGASEGYQKLGQSLLNVFSEQAAQNTHMHLDYFEGNNLLAPTNCHLIFECK